jgi:[pyruvate, water dikinase]-phosphate phosphotransferase / [pyruvate, water dikinase] kinase
MSSSEAAATVLVISDSVGETAESVARAATMQFYPLRIRTLRISFVHDRSSIDQIVHEASKSNTIIVYTIVVPELKQYLTECASQHQVIHIDLLGPIVDTISKVVGQEPNRKIGMTHRLDEQYFKKVEAVEFAVKYDDGRDFSGICQADIVLVGVSRTSKTPLSMYLAHKGYKCANVPIVPEMQPPTEIFSVPKEKVIGLLIDPVKLNAIRKERLRTLGLAANATYANEERIKKELDYAHNLLQKIGCKVIDVSNRAVEETASLILEHIHKRNIPF